MCMYIYIYIYTTTTIMNIYIYIYVVYTYTYTHVLYDYCVYIYIYIYLSRSSRAADPGVQHPVRHVDLFSRSQASTQDCRTSSNKSMDFQQSDGLLQRFDKLIQKKPRNCGFWKSLPLKLPHCYLLCPRTSLNS